MNKKNSYIIIGASAAGIAAAKKIRSLDQESEIICFSCESELPYNKCFLVDWLSNDRTYESLFLHPNQEFFDFNRIVLYRGTRIATIDKVARTVTTTDNISYSYTRLLIATGAGPRFLSENIYSGNRNDKIVPFYTLHDTERIKAIINQPEICNVVILGGGISGLECADALRGYSDKTITLVERASQIGNAHLLVHHAMVVQEHAVSHKVGCITEATVTEVIDVKEGFEIHLSNKSVLKADLIITAMGAIPSTQLAQACGLQLEHGGIATNKFLQTSDPHIFAAGDCATVYESIHAFRMRSCMWSDALVQGMVAGMNMAGSVREYQGALPITVSSLFGLQVVSYQKHLLESEMYRVEHTQDKDVHYSVAYDKDNVVKAFVGIGTEVSYALLKRSLTTYTPYHM